MNRPGGSAFPITQGNSGVLNRVGHEIVEDILTNAGSVWRTHPSGRFGTVLDIVSPSGRGVQYDAVGKFIGFLEP